MNKTDIKATLAAMQAADNERLKLDRESAKLKVKVDSLRDTLIAAGVPSGQYGPYLLEQVTKKVPRCTDWLNLWAYVRENNSFELLHKRLTETAIMERVNAGEIVPGIVCDEKVTYKISAA